MRISISSISSLSHITYERLLNDDLDVIKSKIKKGNKFKKRITENTPFKNFKY